ncbi:dixin-A-like [Xenopus laevis]|uniref:Dixin-A-like n=1 Tax=Xenopus laevis TaxID=8355 RepID=A0A8J1LAS4_XENLA|nr:dixin-A-like [Xenopus laevis]XP_041426628.1 dixin-A-like [Xenopus laevis]
MSHSQSTPVMGSSNSSTKVLYFTDRSLTPFMVTLPKSLGEVTLRDFRAAIGQEGSHRYHFKALDPEFGTVKEEVFHDEDIIPGWEGKIVAWVEEDHGSIWYNEKLHDTGLDILSCCQKRILQAPKGKLIHSSSCRKVDPY